jgi:hypothetical protein
MARTMQTRTFHLLASLSVAAALLFGGSCRAFAANDPPSGLQPMLEELQAADGVILMIVPYPTYPVFALDEMEFQKIACHYSMKEKASLDDVVRVLRDDIIEVRPGPRPGVDYRIGIVFKAKVQSLREFYFNDSGGSFDLRGFSRDHAMKALAGLPNELRALAVRPGAVLVRDPQSRCPHA